MICIFSPSQKYQNNPASPTRQAFSKTLLPAKMEKLFVNDNFGISLPVQ
jgi:hypothetical protein